MESTHQNQSWLVSRLDSTSEVLTSFINEEKERNKRHLKVIVHNVTESSAESGSERKAPDINNVTQVHGC